MKLAAAVRRWAQLPMLLAAQLQLPLSAAQADQLGRAVALLKVRDRPVLSLLRGPITMPYTRDLCLARLVQRADLCLSPSQPYCLHPLDLRRLQCRNAAGHAGCLR